MFTKTTAAVLGLVLAAAPALTAPAFAAEATKVKVEYKDLDLTTAQGQRTLERRLDKAARYACGYDSRLPGTRIASQDARNCYKQARTSSGEAMATAISNATDDTRLGG